MNIRAIGERVVVRRDPPPKVSDGGILLDAAMDEIATCEGEVLSIGPESQGGFEVGDRIVFSAHWWLTRAVDKEDNILVLDDEMVLGLAA